MFLTLSEKVPLLTVLTFQVALSVKTTFIFFCKIRFHFLMEFLGKPLYYTHI